MSLSIISPNSSNTFILYTQHTSVSHFTTALSLQEIGVHQPSWVQGEETQRQGRAVLHEEKL
jgi:hypothetical protein